MTWISEEVLENALDEINSFEPSDAAEQVDRMAEEQPELLAYVLGMTDELGQDARETSMFMAVVLYRAFEIASGKPLPRIQESDLLACDDHNTEMLDELIGKADGAFHLTGLKEAARQPMLLQYVVEAVMETGDDPDETDITEDEASMLFIVMKTVIDVLDQKISPA